MGINKKYFVVLNTYVLCIVQCWRFGPFFFTGSRLWFPLKKAQMQLSASGSRFYKFLLPAPSRFLLPAPSRNLLPAPSNLVYRLRLPIHLLLAPASATSKKSPELGSDSTTLVFCYLNWNNVFLILKICFFRDIKGHWYTIFGLLCYHSMLIQIYFDEIERA